jgi:hypothetical protein
MTGVVLIVVSSLGKPWTRRFLLHNLKSKLLSSVGLMVTQQQVKLHILNKKW